MILDSTMDKLLGMSWYLPLIKKSISCLNKMQEAKIICWSILMDKLQLTSKYLSLILKLVLIYKNYSTLSLSPHIPNIYETRGNRFIALIFFSRYVYLMRFITFFFYIHIEYFHKKKIVYFSHYKLHFSTTIMYITTSSSSPPHHQPHITQ